MAYLFNPFYGQIGRGHWWLLQLVILASMVAVIFFLAESLDDPTAHFGVRNSTGYDGYMYWLLLGSAMYMNFSSSLNRLRDLGRSGFWYLLFLIPVIGTPIMIGLCGALAGPEEPDLSQPGDAILQRS